MEPEDRKTNQNAMRIYRSPHRTMDNSEKPKVPDRGLLHKHPAPAGFWPDIGGGLFRGLEHVEGLECEGDIIVLVALVGED